MAKSFTPYSTLDFNEIERAMKRSRVLRSQVFASIMRDAYRKLTGNLIDDKPVTAREIDGCTSAA